MRVVALPVLLCDGCGDALIFGAECKPCLRRSALRRRLMEQNPAPRRFWRGRRALDLPIGAIKAALVRETRARVAGQFGISITTVDRIAKGERE